MSGKLKKSLTTPTLQCWFSFPFFLLSLLFIPQTFINKHVLTIPDMLGILPTAGNKKKHWLNF